MGKRPCRRSLRQRHKKRVYRIGAGSPAVPLVMWQTLCFGLIALWWLQLFMLNFALRPYPELHGRLGIRALLNDAWSGSGALLAFIYFGKFAAVRDSRVTAVCLSMAAVLPAAIAVMFGPALGLFDIARPLAA